jgi:hypothetical protein
MGMGVERVGVATSMAQNIWSLIVDDFYFVGPHPLALGREVLSNCRNIARVVIRLWGHNWRILSDRGLLGRIEITQNVSIV